MSRFKIAIAASILINAIFIQSGLASNDKQGDVTTPVPVVSTEVIVHPSKVATAEGDTKPSAGDLIEIKITPPAELADGAVPTSLVEKFQQGPVEWNDGRLLWWRPYDSKTGAIIVGATSYTPGKFEIKAIPFSKGEKQVFTSMPKTLEFKSIGGDKMKDEIYPPLAPGLPVWIIVAIGLFALALVLGLIWLVANWSKKRKAKFSDLANAPAILTAREEFERVRSETESKGFLSKLNYKPHYFALSEAAKKFLGKSYRFDAEERTTRELIGELEQLGMSSEIIKQWQKIFDEMDIVKFTDQTPETLVASSLGERLSQIVAMSWSKSPAAHELMLQQQSAANSGNKK